MKIKDKLFYGLMTLSLLPHQVMADGLYGGLEVVDGGLQVVPPDSTASIMGIDPQTTELDVVTNNANVLLGFANFLVVVGIFMAVISLVYSGIQFAKSSGNPQATELAKKRLIYTAVGAALLGGIGFLVNFSFNIIG